MLPSETISGGISSGFVVEAAIRPQFCDSSGWQPLARFAQEPPHVTGGVGAPAPQMAKEQLSFFRPKREQGVIAHLPIVGFRRAFFGGRSLLIDAGVQVNRAGGGLL